MHAPTSGGAKRAHGAALLVTRDSSFRIPRRPQATMYDLAMTIYFGMYGATMTANSELFWGPDSIMMLPCDPPYSYETRATHARYAGT